MSFVCEAKEGYTYNLPCKFLYNASELFHHLWILNVFDLVEFKACVFMYEAFYHLLSSSLQNIFCMSSGKSHC